MTEEARLLKELEEAREADSKAFNECPLGLTIPDFMKYMESTSKKVSEAYRKYRMIQTPNFSEDVPEYGDVMNLREFITCCQCGGFIDYDGFGEYIKDGKTSGIRIYPSDIKYGCIRKDFDQIVWYNK